MPKETAKPSKSKAAAKPVAKKPAPKKAAPAKKPAPAKTAAKAAPAKAAPAPRKERPKAPDQPRKLSFKENAELEALTPRISALEDERAQLLAQLADPAFYKSNPAQVVEANRRLPELDGELEGAVTRWAELEEIRESFARRKQ